MMKKKQWAVLAGDLGLAAAAFLLPWAASMMLAGGSDCIFTRWGLLCPSCGGTRCVEAFFTGRFFLAWDLNPFVTGLLVGGILWLALMNLDAFARQRWAGRLAMAVIRPATVIVLAVGFCLFGIGRNLF
jgi:hypothetical protein